MEDEIQHERGRVERDEWIALRRRPEEEERTSTGRRGATEGGGENRGEKVKEEEGRSEGG